MTWRNGRVINNVFVPNPKTVRSRQPKEFNGDAENAYEIASGESSSREDRQLGPDAFPQFSHLTKQASKKMALSTSDQKESGIFIFFPPEISQNLELAAPVGDKHKTKSVSKKK